MQVRYTDIPVIILYAGLFCVSVAFNARPSYEDDNVSFLCLFIFQLNKINLLITLQVGILWFLTNLELQLFF